MCPGSRFARPGHEGEASTLYPRYVSFRFARHTSLIRMPMSILDGVVDAIGGTPLIRLKRASEATGCTILGKAEFLNPGQSVKDRPAKHMILEAEKRGEVKPGGLVVEATAGNTGIGLA